MTTERDEVHIAGLLKANQTLGHANMLHPRFRLVGIRGFPGLKPETRGTQLRGRERTGETAANLEFSSAMQEGDPMKHKK
jgi:hypothetical protein